MRQILCVITSPEDPLGQATISAQQTHPDCSVKIFDLKEPLNYDQLLDLIIEADSIQVW